MISRLQQQHADGVKGFQAFVLRNPKAKVQKSSCIPLQASEVSVDSL